MGDILSTTEMGNLRTLVEEAARSTREGVKHFVEPAPYTLRRATSRRHHMIFGRRGSGKSSLIQKGAADLTVDRRPIACVDLETFKGHTYPDVLLSVLIATFREFKEWMNSVAIDPSTRTSFWHRLFRTAPPRRAFNRTDAAELSCLLEEQISSLSKELHRADGADLRVRHGSEASEKVSASARAKGGMPIASVQAGIANEVFEKQQQEVVENFRRSKVDFLYRHIMDYQGLFRRLGQVSGGASYLFLDDLYHIRRDDQPKVVDYFHSMAKDCNLWLKVGTIRHRTRWYVHGDPPIGMKLGDDADEIDLDLTLEKYRIAKDFLIKILTNFAQSANIMPLSSFLTDGALDRLVLASGGVARDFLSIFRRSVDFARERSGEHRRPRVGAEDVNKAAGEHDSSKREEFNRDTSDDNIPLEEEFRKLRSFCLDENNSNCFLLDKEEKGPEVDLIHELVDLKLIHLVKSRVTVSGRRGRSYEAYMLDLSQYAEARKRRKLQMVEFWKPSSKEALRKISLIYASGTTSC